MVPVISAPEAEQLSTVDNSPPPNLAANVLDDFKRQGGLLERFEVCDLQSRFAQLSVPLRAVLALILEGGLNKDIAKALDIGLRTVELRRAELHRITGAASLAELVLMAVAVDFPRCCN